MKKTLIITFFLGVFTVTLAQVFTEPTFTASPVVFSVNEDGIKDGLIIPIRVATSTGFTDEEFVMNFGAYNQCRNKGKPQIVCEKELKDDIKQNIATFKINRRNEMKEQLDFKDEINLDNL